MNEPRTTDAQESAQSDSGVYIVASEPGPIKIGHTRNMSNRLGALRQATPIKLTLVFFGIFGPSAPQIEKVVHGLLAPWKVRGEWFAADAFLAGIAIEAVRDRCDRRRQFIAGYAKAHAARGDWRAEAEILDRTDAEFPDLAERMKPPMNEFVGFGRRRVVLPPKKFTRLIVEGFPEVTWSCPAKPALVVAREQYARRRR